MQLEGREEVTSLNLVFLNGRHYITVGTAIFPSDEDFDDFAYAGGIAVSSKEGRMLLIEPILGASSDTWNINVITSLKTTGPVHDSKVIHGFLAVASASNVRPRCSAMELSSTLLCRYRLPYTDLIRILRA